MSITATLGTVVRRYRTLAPWLKPSEIVDALRHGNMCPVTHEHVAWTQRGCFYTFQTKDNLAAYYLNGKALPAEVLS